MNQTIAFCPRCGRQRGADHAFCAGCGRPYDDAAEPLGGQPGERPVGFSTAGGGPAETVARAITIGVLLCVALAAVLVVLVASHGLALPQRLPGLAPPPYQTASLRVPPGQDATVTVDNVRAGQTLEGYFIARGGNDDVSFQVQSPTGSYLVNLGRVSGRYDFHFQVPTDGPYVLIFGNGFSIFTSKGVTLEYRAY